VIAACRAGINMPKKMAEELEKRSASMHISKSKYCKIVLGQIYS